MMSSGKAWTNTELDFLRRNYLSISHKEIGLCIEKTTGAVKAKAQVLGFIKPQFRFSASQIAELRENYADKGAKYFAEKFGTSVSSIHGKAKKLGLKISIEFVRETARQRTLDPNHGGRRTRFSKGQSSWNKGKQIGSHPNSAKTQFKTGLRPRNALSVGDIIPVSRSPYLKIKIAEPNEWKFLHRHVWEQQHGEVPKGYLICFKDGNERNCDISNLEIRSLKENMLRNTIHNYPAELVEAIQTLGRLKRQINRRNRNAEKQN